MRRSLLVLALLAPLATSLAVANRPPRELPPAALAAALRARPTHPLADGRGQVPITMRLAPGEDAAALGLLEVAPGVGARWVDPGELDGFLGQHAARRPWVSPPLRLLSDVAGEKWTRAYAAHDQEHRGKGVVVGVLDTGLDMTHPDLRLPGKGKTRVAWMLDLANKPLGLHPDLEERYGCTQRQQAPCAVLSGQDIDDLLAGEISGAIPPSDGVGHGTHVASIAAGNGESTDKKYVGVAPEATLIAVRVTRSSGGESVTDADLLNSVRFVFDRADFMGLPAVVNISLGGDYGPHDGTSPLEAGLAGFVGPGKPGHAVVVAAGNSGGVLTGEGGQTYGVHTEARTLPDATTRVVMTMPVSTREAKGSAYAWVTFQPGDDVRVGLELNDEALLGPFGRGDQGAVDEETGKNPYLAVINGVVSDTSPLSASTNGAVVVADGTFRAGDRIAITLEGSGTAQLWVQGLGDAEFGSGTGGMLFLNPLKQGTVNVPATHPSLLAVGCTLDRLQWPTLAGPTLEVTQVGSIKNPPGDTVCYFSGAGPNALGVLKPEIAAPGGFVVAAMSRDARPGKNSSSMFSSPPGRCGDIDNCYVVDDFHAVASGTSMSAPQVAGAIALLLAEQPSLTQPAITALLQAGSRRFQSSIPPLPAQSGPGALDVLGSLQALDLPAGGPFAAIDPQRSWLHFSSAFARPDGRWPVVGTVMLRDASGQPTDVLDPTPKNPSAALRPRLEVTNGVVLRPLARVAPGLWQFTVAAPPGTGGERLSARVLLGDQLIFTGNGDDGSMPIAPDIWNIQGMPSARGGCSISR